MEPGKEEAFEKYQYHKKEFEYLQKIVGEPIIDEKQITEFKLTEYGNAERLAYKFGQNIRYCFPWKNWLIWNDKFWEKDATGKIMRMAKGTVRSISKEADYISDEKKKKELKEHGKKSETKFKLNAMIGLAQTEPGLQVKPEDLDKNSWFLNVQNGTIDLKSGILLPHTREMMIPFTVVIQEKEMDKGLKDKLKLELPGILNWAVQGCLEWQKSGLIPPKEISRATGEYRAEMDMLSNFIEDCCVITPHSEVSKTDFYSAYENWCRINRERPISKKAFGTKLIERGTKERKSNSIRYWSGIGLRG